MIEHMVFSLPKKRIDILSILFLFCIIGVSFFLLITVGNNMLLSSALLETQSFTSYTKSFEVVNTLLLSSAFIFMTVLSIGFYIFWRMIAMEWTETEPVVSGKSSRIVGTIFYITLAVVIVWGFFSIPRFLFSTQVEAKEAPALVLPQTSLRII